TRTPEAGCPLTPRIRPRTEPSAPSLLERQPHATRPTAPTHTRLVFIVSRPCDRGAGGPISRPRATADSAVPTRGSLAESRSWGGGRSHQSPLELEGPDSSATGRRAWDR